jgi:outer membrane protein assembly factor BamB
LWLGWRDSLAQISYLELILMRFLLLVARWKVAALLIVGGCSRGQPVAEIRPASPSAASSTQTSVEQGLQPVETDWPTWRGASGAGIATGSAPGEFSATKNVVWSVEVPGKGHASPTIWGDQIFLATADDAQQTMSLVSFDRKTGRSRWTCVLHEGGFMHVHSKNTQASPTAACDGKHVYWSAMVKDAIWLSAVTLAGQIAWQTEVGPFVSMHGYGSSPVLYNDLIIIQGDSNGPGWLAAVNKETGKIHWRVQRGSGASFATPAIAHVAGKAQLLLHGQDKVVSYDPASGDKLWESDGPATVCANTMAWSEDLVFASGGYPQQNTWAIKADGSGQIVWRKNWKCYVPSILVAGELLFVPQDNGVLHCVDAATGKEHWSKRLGGDLTSSPVLADGKLYVTSEDGKTFMFLASKNFQDISAGDLGDRCYSTPTIAGGRIYIRTYSKLFCIGDDRVELPASGE